MVLRISHQWFPQSLALPDKSLANIDAWILPHPHLHRVQSALPVQWDHFVGVAISQHTSFRPKEAIETHVGAGCDRENGLWTSAT